MPSDENVMIPTIENTSSSNQSFGHGRPKNSAAGDDDEQDLEDRVDERVAEQRR